VRPRVAVALVAVALAAVAFAPARAAGFAIFEQGGKAMGMGGAFAARADDPSAVFYNAGGVAFFEERAFYAGIGLISLGDSEFTGSAPFPGPTATGEQKDQLVTPPHAYWVEPIGDKLKFALGVTAPFGLVTQWEGGASWPGRFLSEKAELINIDLTPSLAWRASDKTGIAVGLTARFVEIELRNRTAAINPSTSQPVDISSNKLTSDMETGIGWNVGILHRASDSFSVGLTYKSSIDVDFAGDAEFTQILTGDPVFDAIVAGQLPDADVPIETSIEFPAQATLGVSCKLSDRWQAEFDLGWTGWSSFDSLVVQFDAASGLPDLVRPQGWDDVYNYRGGAEYTLNDRASVRFGLYFDETPQPDESVSPLLPDADRWGYSIGYGRTGGKVDFDAYLLYVDFDDRTTTTNLDNFNGTYKTGVWIVGASVGF